MDRYSFAYVVDEVFKECKTIEELCTRYVKLKDDLENLFKQNMTLLVYDTEKGGEKE